MTSLLRVITLLAFITGAAYADNDVPTPDDLSDVLRVKLRTVQHMALNPVLVSAVLEQNQEDLSLEVIKERDKDWKESEDLTDMKRQLMGNQGEFQAIIKKRCH